MNGDANVNGNFSTSGNITFAGDKKIAYTPTAAGQPAIYSFGGPPVLPASPGGGGACWFPIPNSSYFQIPGILQAHGPSTLDGVENIMNMGFDGSNGIIDIAGGGTDMSNPFPRLLINYYCGKDVFMCTGQNGGSISMCTPTLGKVCIGIDPSLNIKNYKLAVNGTIGAKEVVVEKTQTPWPDYVFQKNYKLISLKDVEKYISENSHLPELPSAKEIEQNGINLGETNAILLKKVEELTLYIIEQNKRIEKLEMNRENH